ncbi:MAG: hypothetical protein ACT4N2_01500 [Hyphomicrobium sp.]
MNKVSIQAYEDRSRAEGGHAVLLLHGITEPEGKVVFRIRVADATRAGDTGGWIGGEHVPVGVKATDQGTELVVGPEVTESEHLLPGTVVELELSGSGARGEFLWPNVAPLMRPRRRSIVGGKSRNSPRNSADKVVTPVFKTVSPAAADPDVAMTEPTVVAAPVLTPISAPVSTPVAAPVIMSASPEASAAVDLAEALRVAAASVAVPQPIVFKVEEPRPAIPIETVATAFAHSRSHEAPMKDDKPTGPAQSGLNLQESTDEIARKYGWAFRKDVSVMLSKKFFALGASRSDAVQDEALSAVSHSPHHTIASEATAILASHEDEEHASIGDQTLAPITSELIQIPSDPVEVGASGETFYPHARGSLITNATPEVRVEPRAPFAAKMAPQQPMNVRIAAALATLAIGGVAAVTLLSGRPSIGAGEPPAKTAAVISPAPSQAPASGNPAVAAVNDALMFDALTVGATSPRGAAASGISLTKALENANVQLQVAGAGRDTEEGAFWLKKYIVGTLSEDRTVRALTQLGSVFAEPTGKAPDYTKARFVWEIASAAGDPVAMCFIGLLHENGLGVAASRSAALQWYERSKEKGGCPGIEESLQRVRQ